MRILRLRHGELPYWARWVDEGTARLWTDAPFDGGTETDRLVPLGRTEPLPAVTPSKIVCVGRNYRAHAEELGNEVPETPLLFLKPPSALLPHGGTIELPSQSERVEHEAELGVVIGRALRNASEAEARAAVFGYTCVNDVTARDLQRRDVQFTRGKGFDTFCPVGPWIETEPPAGNLAIECRVGDDIRQQSDTGLMIWGPAALLAFISSVMTLEPGDLVSTGTPAGVGPLAHGDTVEVRVEGVGHLQNHVAEPDRP